MQKKALRVEEDDRDHATGSVPHAMYRFCPGGKHFHREVVAAKVFGGGTPFFHWRTQSRISTRIRGSRLVW